MIHLSEHSIDRYRERIRPDLSREEAKERLLTMLRSAIRMREKTRYGDVQYRCEDCVLVVKETHDSGLLAVTVYPLPIVRGQPTPQEWSLVMERIVGSASQKIAALDEDHEPLRPRASVPRDPARRVEFALCELDRILEQAEAMATRMKKKLEKKDGRKAEIGKVHEQVRHLHLVIDALAARLPRAELEAALSTLDPRLLRKLSEKGSKEVSPLSECALAPVALAAFGGRRRGQGCECGNGTLEATRHEGASFTGWTIDCTACTAGYDEQGRRYCPVCEEYRDGWQGGTDTAPHPSCSKCGNP